MPVEEGEPGVWSVPYATYGVGTLVVVASALCFINLDYAVFLFGFMPEYPWRFGGLTFLTSFFVHGDLLHLVGNMYFLLVFGDNVEDYLGRLRYLALLGAATITGGLLDMALEPHAKVVGIGASGGISGILAFYLLRFPKARLVLWWLHLGWVRISARWALLLWVLLQLLGSVRQMAGGSSVGYLAHLGGALAGVAAWLLWRKADYGNWRAALTPGTAAGRGRIAGRPSS